MSFVPSFDSLVLQWITDDINNSHYVWAPHQDTALEIIPELQIKTADVWLQVIKKNRILYQAEVDDPLYAAHQQVQFLDASTEENTTVYISDAPASVLGCSSQVSCTT